LQAVAVVTVYQAELAALLMEELEQQEIQIIGEYQAEQVLRHQQKQLMLLVQVVAVVQQHLQQMVVQVGMEFQVAVVVEIQVQLELALLEMVAQV
jgi:hypothetical protein